MADADIHAQQITGLVLAGGLGSRLGGIDKGLQTWRGKPLALRAVERLVPQVGRVMLSANRHRDDYAAWGFPVWPDLAEWGGHQGPLAGIMAGLHHCETPYLATVPCDCPDFPLDLVTRLSSALRPDIDIAIARTVSGAEPAFCLMRCTVARTLHDYLQSGERKIERWTAQLPRAEVHFDEPSAFFNINTPGDLARS